MEDSSSWFIHFSLISTPTDLPGGQAPVETATLQFPSVLQPGNSKTITGHSLGLLQKVFSSNTSFWFQPPIPLLPQPGSGWTTHSFLSDVHPQFPGIPASSCLQLDKSPHRIRAATHSFFLPVIVSYCWRGSHSFADRSYHHSKLPNLRGALDSFLDPSLSIP